MEPAYVNHRETTAMYAAVVNGGMDKVDYTWGKTCATLEEFVGWTLHTHPVIGSFSVGYDGIDELHTVDPSSVFVHGQKKQQRLHVEGPNGVIISISLKLANSLTVYRGQEEMSSSISEIIRTQKNWNCSVRNAYHVKFAEQRYIAYSSDKKVNLQLSNTDPLRVLGIFPEYFLVVNYLTNYGSMINPSRLIPCSIPISIDLATGIVGLTDNDFHRRIQHYHKHIDVEQIKKLKPNEEIIILPQISDTNPYSDLISNNSMTSEANMSNQPPALPPRQDRHGSSEAKGNKKGTKKSLTETTWFCNCSDIPDKSTTLSSGSSDASMLSAKPKNDITSLEVSSMYSENDECRTRSVGQEATHDYGESTTEPIYLQPGPRYGCLPTDDTRDVTKYYTTAPQSKFLYQSLQKTSPPDYSPHLPLWHHYDVLCDHESSVTNSSKILLSHFNSDASQKNEVFINNGTSILSSLCSDTMKDSSDGYPPYTSTNSSGVRDRMSYNMRNAISNNDYCFMTAGRLHNASLSLPHGHHNLNNLETYNADSTKNPGSHSDCDGRQDDEEFTDDETSTSSSLYLEPVNAPFDPHPINTISTPEMMSNKKSDGCCYYKASAKPQNELESTNHIPVIDKTDVIKACELTEHSLRHLQQQVNNIKTQVDQIAAIPSQIFIICIIIFGVMFSYVF